MYRPHKQVDIPFGLDYNPDPPPTMPATSFMIVSHETDLSVDFIAQCVWLGDGQRPWVVKKTLCGTEVFVQSPSAHAAAHGKGGFFYPRVTIIRPWKKEHGFCAYCDEDNFVTDDIVHFVIGDGSKSMMPAFLNSTLSKQVLDKGIRFQRGGTLNLKKYAIIWKGHFPHRLVAQMIIFDMDYTLNPAIGMESVYEITRWKTRDYDLALDHNEVVFCTKFKPRAYENFSMLTVDAKEQMYARADREDFLGLSYIRNPDVKAQIHRELDSTFGDLETALGYNEEHLVAKMSPGRTSVTMVPLAPARNQERMSRGSASDPWDPKSNCECWKHGYQNCAIWSLLFGDVDEDMLLQCTLASLSEDQIYTRKFKELKQGHKRYCWYRWAALNLFGFSEREELPLCVRQAIRKKYKDPQGRYSDSNKKESKRHGDEDEDAGPEKKKAAKKSPMLFAPMST